MYCFVYFSWFIADHLLCAMKINNISCLFQELFRITMIIIWICIIHWRLYAIIDWARTADSYGKRQIGQENESAEIGNQEAALIAATVTTTKTTAAYCVSLMWMNERRVTFKQWVEWERGTVGAVEMPAFKNKLKQEWATKTTSTAKCSATRVRSCSCRGRLIQKRISFTFTKHTNIHMRNERG